MLYRSGYFSSGGPWRDSNATTGLKPLWYEPGAKDQECPRKVVIRWILESIHLGWDFQSKTPLTSQKRGCAGLPPAPSSAPPPAMSVVQAALGGHPSRPCRSMTS